MSKTTDDGLLREGDLDVLVATTVIEVGVDVPNATTMVILSQTDRHSAAHQLRRQAEAVMSRFV